MKHVLVADLESGGTEKDSAVFSIAAILLDVTDPQTVERLAQSFEAKSPSEEALYQTLHVGNQWLDGRRLDEDTQRWWLQARLATPRALIKDGIGDFKEALLELKRLVDKLKVLHEAEYGPDSKIVLFFRDRQFDDNILQHAAEQYGVELGYIFNQRRDIRTYIDAKLNTTIGYIPDFKPFPNLPRHHAMTDVLRDSASMCEAYRRALLHTPATPTPT